jgi:hypothetical protein
LTCGKANEASLSPFQLRSAEAIAESPSIRSGSETQETPERASLGVVKELPSTWTQDGNDVLESGIASEPFGMLDLTLRPSPACC